MNNSIGTHIMGDLKQCDSVALFNINMEEVKSKVSEIIKRNHLTELGSYYHHFDNNSFTCVVALSESHVSIHTWPELGVVNLDVYTCNYQNDNTENTRRVFEEISAIFGQSEINKIEVKR